MLEVEFLQVSYGNFDSDLTQEYFIHCINKGAKGDWDFWISDLVKNLDGADI